MYPPVPYPPVLRSSQGHERARASPTPSGTAPVRTIPPTQAQNMPHGGAASTRKSPASFEQPPTRSPTRSRSPSHAISTVPPGSVSPAPEEIKPALKRPSSTSATPRKYLPRTPASSFKSPLRHSSPTNKHGGTPSATLAEYAKLKRSAAKLRKAKRSLAAPQLDESDDAEEPASFVTKRASRRRRHSSSSSASNTDDDGTLLAASSPPTASSHHFPSPARTNADIIDDYRRSLADEAAYKGVSEGRLRAARQLAGGEDDELRTLEEEVRGRVWNMRPAKRTKRDEEPLLAPDATASTVDAQLAPSAQSRAKTGKAFVLPRRAPPPPPEEDSESEDDLLDALDRLIKAWPTRIARPNAEEEARAGPSQLAGGGERATSCAPGGSDLPAQEVDVSEAR